MSRCTSCSLPTQEEACCTARGLTKGLVGTVGTGAFLTRASAADGILLVLMRPPDVVVVPWEHSRKPGGNRGRDSDNPRDLLCRS